MSTTREILQGLPLHQRADFLLTGLSSGGLLPATKAKEFIRIAQNKTPLLQQVRVVPMPSPTYSLPKIIFGSMITKADSGDGTALDSGDRSAPTTSEVSLVAKKYMSQVDIGYDLLKDNVEGEEILNTLMALIAERFGLDMEIIGLSSDTDSATAVLAQQDGWIKRASTNVIAASNADISRSFFEQAISAVPLRFRQDGKHAFFVEEYAGEKWRSIVGDRATPAGDKYVIEGDIPTAAGRPVIQVGNMPVATGTPNTAPVLFANPKNLLMGVWQDVNIKSFDDVVAGKIRIVVRTRVAFNFEHEPAVAKITGVKARS